MARGGTRKERARQVAERRSRERKARVKAGPAKKKRRKERVRYGRGRAVLLHLAGGVAPLILAFGLWRSGQASTATSTYWLEDLINDPNASYFSEPVGLAYAAVIFSIATTAFAVLSMWLWRRLYREHDPLFKDRSSVDGAFTLATLAGAGWVFRIVGGYGDAIANFAVIMTLFAVFIPIYSAILGVGMPVTPGSGRIGSIIPKFVRIPFSEHFLLTDEERELVRVLNEAAKKPKQK